jgi:nitroreductase
MEFSDVVLNRRSIRKFSEQGIPESVIRKALDDALRAPNSSNMQPWEFYWVRSIGPKQKLIEACFSQSAAKTASDLVVAVSRIDTWTRNRRLMLDLLEKTPSMPERMKIYYEKVIPMAYFQDWFNITGFLRKIIFGILGIFRPVPRGPASRAQLFEVVTKTTALACENFMLSITDQGYASCPMEGFDECRVKKILGLGHNAHVVMVLGIGRSTESHTPGTHIRFSKELFIKEI